jgi:predicted membrane-bound spermidine synthase
MLVLLYGVVPGILFFPSTVLMGFSFGILQRAVHDDAGTTGYKVGVLQAVNLLGNIAGSLVTGLVLLDRIGTPGTFRLLMVIGLGFAALGLYHYGLRPALVAPAAVLLLLITGFPDNERFWARLHGLTGQPSVFVEDSSAVAAVGPEEGFGLRVSVNGKGQSNLPFGGVHSRLGAAPALVHDSPQRIAIIGLGSGDTAWAAGCRSDTQEIRVFEIAGSVETALASVRREGLQQLDAFLSDPRVEIEITDGRNALARDETLLYDVIEADAIRPHGAYSGNLYSVEFFELCARRLRPGGIMSAWAPTLRTYHTFTVAFPHVVELDGGEILLGSNEPIEITPDVWRHRLRRPDVIQYLGRTSGEVGRSLATARPARTGLIDTAPNFDLFPRDEFLTPPVR